MDIIQVSESEWEPEYDYVPICTLPVEAGFLVENHGIGFRERVDHRLGRLASAVLRLEGKLVSLATYPDGPAGARLVQVRVQGNEPDPEKVVRLVSEAFDVAEADLEWKSPLLQASRWILYRVDENGNEFEIDRFLVRCIAENVAARFEAKGHGQTCLVREATASHREGGDG